MGRFAARKVARGIVSRGALGKAVEFEGESRKKEKLLCV